MEDEPPGEKKKEEKKRKPTIFYGGHGEPRLESVAIPLPKGLEIRMNVSHGSFPFRPPSQERSHVNIHSLSSGLRTRSPPESILTIKAADVR